MKKVNIIVTTIICASLGGCLMFTYLWLDRSISLGYMEQAYSRERGAVVIFQELLRQEWGGLSEGEILKKLEDLQKKLKSDVVLKQEGSVIFLENIEFHVKNGRLESVNSK